MQADILRKHWKDISFPLPIWYQDGLTKWKSGKLILQGKRYACISPDGPKEFSWLLLWKIRPRGATSIQDREETVNAGSQHGRSHPWQGHAEETWRARWIRTWGTPLTCSSIYPQTRIYFMPCINSSDINGDYPRPPFSGENQLRALANKSPGHDRSVSVQTPLMAF